jgi:hypothetical protein
VEVRRQIGDDVIAPDVLGTLHDSKHWDRKKILEWNFSAPQDLIANAVARLGPPNADISIKREDDGLIFVADSPWFGDARRRNEITDKTLIGLRRKVEAMFRDQILAHTKVQWEDWIEIKMADREVDEEADDTKAGSARVSIEWEILKRAKFPDGRDMVLDGRSLYPFPQAKPSGQEGPQYAKGAGGMGRWNHRVYSQEESAQYAYIPATPENIDAMRALRGKINEVNNRLLSILSQETIKRTVTLLAGGALRLEKK